MKLAMVVNNIHTEAQGYTTTGLALEATNMGHEVWYVALGDFAYDPDENVHARARRVPAKKYRSERVFLATLCGEKAIHERVTLDDFDVVFLRNDPAEDVLERPWARLVGINFGRLVTCHGTIVLNDPNGLAQAVNKMYLQYFSESVRPATLITRDSQEIKDFIKQQGGGAVLKPLSGSGGRNVFLIRPDERANINQIIEAVSREGYIIAQQYIPEAREGDTRLFLMNGQPLMCKGRYAAIHRVRVSDNGDMRSNMSAGAAAQKAVVTDKMLEMADLVKPKLIQDGMFFVGLDIVGDKLMEINVFSPGGLHSASVLEERNFHREVIHALERKVEYMQKYHRNIGNLEIATM